MKSPADCIDAVPVADDAAAGSIERAEQAVRQMQARIDGLNDEIGVLRRRDVAVTGIVERLDEEQRLAARLQQDFLPKTLPRVGSIEFHTLFRPAGYVSGDLYDVMRLDETHVAFYLADAVGHGMPAALLTMFMKNALTTKAITPGGYELLAPGTAIAKLNDTLVDQQLSNGTFATAVYGTIDTANLTLSFARGGHPSPLLLRDGTLTELEADGALLGVFPNETFHNCTVKLQPGDRVFVFSDGVECAFPDPADNSRCAWRDAVSRQPDQPVATLVKGLADHIDGDQGSIAPKDDLTVIVVDVK